MIRFDSKNPIHYFQLRLLVLALVLALALALELVLAVVQVAKPPEVLAILKLTALFATLKMQPVQLSV